VVEEWERGVEEESKVEDELLGRRMKRKRR
jgi:hypothetical protein